MSNITGYSGVSTLPFECARTNPSVNLSFYTRSTSDSDSCAPRGPNQQLYRICIDDIIAVGKYWRWYNNEYIEPDTRQTVMPRMIA